MRTPLTHKPLREVVADEIRRMIIAGEIEGGQRLVEDRLAEQLGVSRNPVREAIRSLESSGLVEVVPRKGAYAARLDTKDVRAIQEIRLVIEAWIIEQATLNRSEDDIATIDWCIAEGRAATAAGNTLRASEMHRRFHEFIEQSCGNPYVALVTSPLRQRTELVFTVLRPDQAEVSWEEHEQIRDAIVGGDPATARTLIVSHISSAMQRFEQRGD